MSLESLMNVIEDYEFASRVTIASDLRTFFRGAIKQPEFKELMSNLDLEEDQGTIIARLHSLLATPHDRNLQHPADTAIAIYLLVLAFKDWSTASRIAEQLLNVENLWWATQVARQISQFNQSPIDSTGVRSDELVVQLQGRSGLGQ